ncbi:MAG: family 16 glycoside hydrolase, partial [Planctomycetaceae bacterium]|nr:family 16 glycoside hydrolase [Planctomycetaceae bacterium]
SVVNGVLIGKTPNQPLASFSYLCTPSSYRDFELKLRVKLLPGGNSGVQIRSRRSDPANFDVLGPQVEFVDARELIWGTLIEVPSANRPTYRPTYRANVDAVQAALKPGEFNDLLVTCQGRHVTVRLNGTLVNDVDYPDMSETGIIALQLHKAKPMEVQFQEISLRQLKTVSPPADAKTFQGHAYKFYPEQLSWKAAKARCEGLGGHLVIVESEAENGFVAGLVADANRDDCWIGATDEASEGQWRWVDGRPLTWTNWFTRQNQPNNKPPGEDYALMSNKRLAVDGLIGWEWSDQPNQALPAHKPGYLCEWDATPNSQATALGADLDDLARWQGKWRCIAENTQGHNATLEEVAERNHTMLIEGTRRSVERMINGKIQPYSGRFRINPAAVPQEFDFDFDDLKVAGGQRGLYEFDGSGLRLIYRGSNTEKPARANWSDKGQSNVSWFEFERVDDGWTDLFNGKDLTGWQGRQDLWTLRDGVLTGQAGSSDTNSFLFSPRPYADFELQFQVRIGANDNSGVQIRSEILDRNQWTARGQQCDIGNRPGDFWGGIYGENLPGGWLLKPGSAPAVKSGDWNDYSLRCVGRRVTIQVNGATTVDGDVAEMKDAGLLAFQIHRENQRPVEFRSIRIRLANLAATNSLDPDRKAAEWVLGIGGRVRVAAGESVSPWILPGGSLPDSAFQLHSVFTADDGKPWKESELRVLSGLAGLRAINFEQPISHTDATMEIVETLTGLESLRFEDSNEMTDAGLRRLAALTNLRALGLVSSRMTDATLEVLARLPQLDDLSLGITGYGSDPGKAAPLVTADGLAHLKKADKLSSLNLYGVPVDDAGLQRIGECRQVRSLKLGGSSVSDAGLQHLAGMTQLTTLRLRLTAVTDAGLVHLQGLQNLETLDLEGSPVTGRGTEHLRGLEKLRGLCLSASPVDDAGLEQIKSLTQLTLLDVRGSKVTDAGVPHLVGLAERLEVLHLIGTAITDASVPHLAKLSNLKSLNLDGSQITPAGLGRLRKALPQCNISPAPSNPQ